MPGAEARLPTNLLFQFFVGESTRLAIFSFPTNRLAARKRPPLPFVETVMDDVHFPAAAPARPGDAAGGIENALVGWVEFDAEFVEHGGPEPFDVLRGTPLQLFDTNDAVAVHELS
jgi:hypothetical protein